MNNKRKTEFARSFAVNEEFVEAAHERVQYRIREHFAGQFSGMEFEAIPEVELFKVLSSIKQPVDILHSVGLGRLAENVIEHALKYFDELPEFTVEVYKEL